MYNIIRVLTKRVCIKNNYYRHINGVPYKMQFAAYFYTVVPYQALIRLQIYTNSAISKSGAFFFCHFARYAISVPQLIVYAMSLTLCDHTI